MAQLSLQTMTNRRHILLIIIMFQSIYSWMINMIRVEIWKRIKSSVSVEIMFLGKFQVSTNWKIWIKEIAIWIKDILLYEILIERKILHVGVVFIPMFRFTKVIQPIRCAYVFLLFRIHMNVSESVWSSLINKLNGVKIFPKIQMAI